MSNMLTMNHKQLREYLTQVAPRHVQVPTIILSEPGLGKSQSVNEAMHHIGYSVVDIRGAQKQPCDLFMPWPDAKKGVLRCLVAGWLKNMTNKTCLFLDEILNADIDVQKVLLQLLRDRCCGEGEDVVRLPEDCIIIGASNRVEDRAGANRAISSLASRACFIGLTVSAEEWVEGYAQPRGLNGQVVAYHQWKIRSGAPCLTVFDPKDPTKTSYPCPRTWEYTSMLLPDLTKNTRDAVITGLLGSEVAADFCGFLEVQEDRPDVNEILKNPAKAPIPSELQVLYSVIGELTEMSRTQFAQQDQRPPLTEPERKDRNAKAIKIAQYFLRFEKDPNLGEFTAFSLKMLIQANPSLVGQKDVMAWWTANMKDIQGAA